MRVNDEQELLPLSSQTLIQTSAALGARLESSVKLLSAIAGLTAIPLKDATLPEAATETLEILVRGLDDIENCSLLLCEPDGQLLKLLAARGHADLMGETDGPYNKDVVFKVGEGIAGKVFAENVPCFWNRDSHEATLISLNPDQPWPQSLACMPLSTSEGQIGVLNISFYTLKPFDYPRKCDLLILCGVVANVVRTFLLKTELSEKAAFLAKNIAELKIEIAERKRAEEALRKTQAILTRAQKMALLGSWEMDLSSGELICSEEITEIYGIAPSELPKTVQEFLDYVHCSDRPFVRESLENVLPEDTLVRIEHRIEHSSGSEHIVHQLAEVKHDDKGRPVKLVGTMQDITELRRSEEQTRLLARVFENTVEGIIVTDAQQVIQMVNPAFSVITGYSAGEAIGKTPRILSSKRHDSEFFKNIWSSLDAADQWQGEIWDRRKNGEAYPEWLTITVIRDAQNHITHYVGVFHDITTLKRSEEQIAFRAYHDAVTGLPNRLLFNDRLSMSIAHAQRNCQGLAVLFLDLDNFKNINDSLGHAMGDSLLQSFARRLSCLVREEDTVARLGGDEFIILLQSTGNPNYAVHIAKRILKSLQQPFRIKEHELYISASIGIAIFPNDGTNNESLISNADAAMYRAKEQGRNNYTLFTHSMNVKVAKRLTLENRLHKALEQGEFLLHYQPKIALCSGQVTGLEALVRWQRTRVELVPPDDFIPVAEETGLIVALGEWVLRTACTRTKQWHDEGFSNLEIAVNLSPRQFQQKNLVCMVRNILAQTGLPPRSLELELTEGAVMHNVEEAIATLQELSDLGILLSMDDFGRGYSSLYFLKRFPMNTLKIDRCFVDDIGNSDGASIVRTIISMSHSLNLEVVAEGVETRDQLDFLSILGCNQVQGYLLSRPLPPEDIAAFLKNGLNETRLS